MNKIFLLLLLCFTVRLFAQNEQKVARLQKVVDKYTAEKAKFESHLKKLVDQLKLQDAAIEEQIQNAIDFIKQYEDSEQTNNRIIRNKERVLSGLRKSIKNYSDRRQTIVNEMKYGSRYFNDDMGKVKEWFDKKIELRVSQIVEVAKSLDSYKDYYDKNDNGSNYNDKTRVERADRDRSKLIKKMNLSIEQLNKKSAQLEKELENTDSRYSMPEVAGELTATAEKIELLQSSIDDIWKGAKGGNKVGSQASMAIDRELRKKITPIKTGSYTFFRQFDATIRLLKKRKTLQDTIDKYTFAIQQLK